MNQLCKIKFIFIFYGVFTFVCNANTVFVDALEAPPGFEKGAPQHLRASVFFMNEPIGFFSIVLHQGQLTFQTPELLFKELKNLNKKSQALSLLQQSFPLNLECSSNGLASLLEACQDLKKNLYT